MGDTRLTMQQDQYIIDTLGVSHFSDEKRVRLLEQVRTLIGEAISAELSEQQLNEYQAIIDDRELVIELWLKQNVPEYKNSPIYQEIVAASEHDPEHNRPEKIFANLAWIERNVPNVKAISDQVLKDFKDQHFRTT